MSAPRWSSAAGAVAHAERGITLLEVLITLLVLAVGLLALGRLELMSIRSAHSSFLRGQAVALAYDMADRMRANPRALATTPSAALDPYNGANPSVYGLPTDHACTARPGQTSADCSVAEMAAHDQFEWQQLLASVLPAGTGVTCRDSSPDDGTPVAPACDDAGDSYAVKVWWVDLDESGPADRRFVLRVRP